MSTEQPDPQSDNVTTPIEPTPGPTPSRWQRLRPRTRLSRIAATVVTAAAAVFVAGAVFFSGFALGSAGGEHHGHGGNVAEHSFEKKHHHDQGPDQHS